MPDDRDNYCRLIGLNPTKESTYSVADIEKKITAKEAKWRKESENKQNALDKRFQFDDLLKLVPDMRRVMRDPGLRSKEFDGGRQLLRSRASGLGKESITLHDGSKVLLPGADERLHKRIQWEGVSKEDLVNLAGIKRTTVPKTVDEKIKTAYKGLREVNAFTPMDILNELIGNKGLEIMVKPLSEGASIAQIKTAFEACEKRVNNVRPDTLPHQDSYIQSLRSLKMVLSPDQALADTIKYGKCMKILVPVMAIMDEEYSQPFTREYIDNILNTYLRNTNADRDMAIALLEEFCVKRKYLANFSSKESKLIQCGKCRSFVESGGQIMCCSVCGASIRTRCPQCGTDQPAGNNACVKCGFDFQDGLRKAKDLEEKFNSDLNSGLIDDARNDLRDIRMIYSSYPELGNLSDRLKTATARYDTAIRNMEQSFKLKRFHDVSEYSKSYAMEFPTLIQANLELRKKTEESSKRVKDADDLCAKALETEDGSERMRLYASASEKCPDHPIARSKMADYPPDSPADALVQVRDSKVLIKFAVPEERSGMTFCIYRNPNTLPVVTEDTVPLAEIPGSVFLDKTPEPGVDYYYSIYSKRWGILSREAASCGPAITFVEVDDVSIEPIQDGLKIIYEKPKGCSRVRIWRKEGTSAAGTGDEVELVHNGDTVIEDRNLKGGMKYHYLFVAEYANGNRTERSRGTDFSCTTVKFPEPVRDMDIRWNKSDGSYTAKWSSRENVILYSSSKKMTVCGRMIKMEDINTWLTEIQPLDVYDNGMRFMLPDGAVQYIYPMIPIGKTAIRGKDMMVANLKPFRDVEKRISGGDCDITMSWPTDAESAVIVIKDSSSGTDDNSSAERISISREAYNADRKVRISIGNSKKKMVTLYAVYDVSGDKMESRGMSVEVYSGAYSKVRYSMVSEKSTKTENRLMISMDTDPDVKELPPMAAIRVSEGIPLKINDGESIWSSGRPVAMSAGKAMISLTCDPKLDLRKVRLFFVDDENYNLFRFIHPIYRSK